MKHQLKAKSFPIQFYFFTPSIISDLFSFINLLEKVCAQTREIIL